MRQARESCTTIWARQASEQLSKLKKLECTVPATEVPRLCDQFPELQGSESWWDALKAAGCNTEAEWCEKFNLPRVHCHLSHSEPPRPAPDWVVTPMTCFFRPINPETGKGRGDTVFVLFEPTSEVNERVYAWIMSHAPLATTYAVPSKEAFEQFLEPFQRSSGDGAVMVANDTLEEGLAGRLGWLHADAIKAMGPAAALDMAFACDIRMHVKDENTEDGPRSTILSCEGVSDAGKAFVALYDWRGADEDEYCRAASGLCIETTWDE